MLGEIFVYLNDEGKDRIMEGESKKEPPTKARNSDLTHHQNGKNRIDEIIYWKHNRNQADQLE